MLHHQMYRHQIAHRFSGHRLHSYLICVGRIERKKESNWNQL